MQELKLSLLLLVLNLTQGWKQVEAQRIHTLFSVECNNYFDWQTVGLVHSFKKSGQPGEITRLLSCTEEERKKYRGWNLAPTFEVPSFSKHPRTGDWYPAINKPVGIVHWLTNSKDAGNVDWVVILDADMIIRGPIIPWELGAEKGKPVAAYYGYLIGCDNILAQLHTSNPHLCDKVGGLLAMHITDLKALAHMWLSKTEEVRADKAHWMSNITGDIYGQGWISEMYGYSFGAAEVGLKHKIYEGLMIYPGYIPVHGLEPILLHYGLRFRVGNWSFSKLDHHEDNIVYQCGRLFPEPPYPREVLLMESDSNLRKAMFLSIECMNTLNEGLLHHHISSGCPLPLPSKYINFLNSKMQADLTRPKFLSFKPTSPKQEVLNDNQVQLVRAKVHTVFSAECSSFFDWQTVGLVHSFRESGQTGNITRLLTCSNEELKHYTGHDLAPTHYVPSMSYNPLTGDWYPPYNKPAAVLHWLNHADIDAEFIIVLDADMILRGPIIPWDLKAARGRPVSAPFDYLIGCDNELAELHTHHPDVCDKVGSIIIIHIDDLRTLSLLWMHKTEEVRVNRARYSIGITGDMDEVGSFSEKYGYVFAASELNLRHIINKELLIQPGDVPVPGVNYRVFHYSSEFWVRDWRFNKDWWRNTDMINKCWHKFPDPPDPSSLDRANMNALLRDLLSIECAKALNRAFLMHHKERNCPVPRDGSFQQKPHGPHSDNSVLGFFGPAIFILWGLLCLGLLGLVLLNYQCLDIRTKNYGGKRRKSSWDYIA